ncbi:hypothetical protein FHS82_002768 [Pseudochelatococcus lubricantis]|uniref:DUF1468 domain-containing protein n=1 Tax=Pseudochelatococcus lubricantis TaxID=1538102 RepID=A0ABX0V1A7_9HYPH|nr:tripartite tricarboxylate transporter TctB family protein [Pseudochelatococcus lubricantis]NIJ58913.1 hypothetical protein [Pseudochelatococcus lubricantis]
MSVKDVRDVIGGALLIAVGIAAAIAASGYGIGNARNIGPGFFPVILAGLLVLTGCGIVVSAVDFKGGVSPAPPIRLDAWHLWCLVVVAGGFVLFGLLLPVAGLFLTCLVSIAAVGAGSRLLTPVGALATAVVLAAIAVVLFRYLLDLQVQAWPWGG